MKLASCEKVRLHVCREAGNYLRHRTSGRDCQLGEKVESRSTLQSLICLYEEFSGVRANLSRSDDA